MLQKLPENLKKLTTSVRLRQLTNFIEAAENLGYRNEQCLDLPRFMQEVG